MECASRLAYFYRIKVTEAENVHAVLAASYDEFGMLELEKLICELDNPESITLNSCAEGS